MKTERTDLVGKSKSVKESNGKSREARFSRSRKQLKELIKMSENPKEGILAGKITDPAFKSNIEEIRVHLCFERCPNCLKSGELHKSKFICDCGKSYLAVSCLNCGLTIIP